jgi:hypothetical protein
MTEPYDWLNDDSMSADETLRRFEEGQPVPIVDRVHGIHLTDCERPPSFVNCRAEVIFRPPGFEVA